jgi:hypothetical protein
MLAYNLRDGIFVTAKINPRLDELLNIFVDFGGCRLDLIVGHAIAPLVDVHEVDSGQICAAAESKANQGSDTTAHYNLSRPRC